MREKGTWAGKGGGDGGGGGGRGQQNPKTKQAKSVTGGEDKQRLTRRRTNDIGRDGKRERHWRWLR